MARQRRAAARCTSTWPGAIPWVPTPVPGDVTAGDPLALEGRSQDRPLTVAISSREPGDDLLGALSVAVERAERGVIVAGRLPDDRLSAALAELAELAGFPILAEPTSQLRFGRHDRSAVIAAYDLISRSQPQSLSPDLVLRFGDMPTSKPLRAWLATSDADQIVVDPPGRWNEPSRRAGAFVRADAGSVIAGICSRIPQAGLDWRQGWVDAEAAAQEAIDAVLSEWEDTGLNEPGVQRLLGGAYEDGDRVLIASSMPIRDAEAFLGGGEAGVRFHANRGANGIDGLIATGSGFALASGYRSGSCSETWRSHTISAGSPLRRRSRRRSGSSSSTTAAGESSTFSPRPGRSSHPDSPICSRPRPAWRSSGSPASSGSPSRASRTRPVWPGSEPSTG